jgi:hypothetical protein
MPHSFDSSPRLPRRPSRPPRSPGESDLSSTARMALNPTKPNDAPGSTERSSSVSVISFKELPLTVACACGNCCSRGGPCEPSSMRTQSGSIGADTTAAMAAACLGLCPVTVDVEPSLVPVTIRRAGKAGVLLLPPQLWLRACEQAV